MLLPNSVNNKFLRKDSTLAEKALTFLLKPSKLRAAKGSNFSIYAR